MKFMEKAKRFFTLNAANHEGFTLVELIVVIAILAILAGVAVPVYSGYIKKAEKAGDMQLLAAVNEAFAAACMAEGTQAILVNSAALTWSDAGAVTGITSVDGSYDAGIDEAFKMFYKGNEGTAFKVLAKKLSFKNGVFGEINSAYSAAYDNVIQNMTTQISSLQNSAFADIGAADLLAQVTDVSALATKMIKDGGTITGLVMSTEYMTTMAEKLGYDSEAEMREAVMEMYSTDPDAFAKYMANSTVLNVAATMNGMSTEDESAMKNTIANLDIGDLSKTLADDPETGLAQAALLYGMYTAFDPEGAAGMASEGNVNKLVALQNNSEFAAYVAQINDPNSQAGKDYAGYMSALQIVDGAVTNDSSVADQVMTNGYGDGDLLALMQQVMGK